MQDGILFDNLLITNDPAVASTLAQKTFLKRKTLEDAENKKAERESAVAADDGKGVVGKVKKYARKAFFWAQDNPKVLGLSIFIGLIPLVLMCCWPSGRKDEEEYDDEYD